MMRAALLAAMLIAGCAHSASGPTSAAGAPVPGADASNTAPAGGAGSAEAVDPAAWRDGPGGFPLPVDADNGTRVLGDDHDVTFVVGCDREVVYRALVAKLAADGFTVDDEKLVLGGHRMHVHRGDARYFVSVTENDDSTLLTITVK